MSTDDEDDEGCASLLGMLDNPEVARYIVDLHNASLPPKGEVSRKP